MAPELSLVICTLDESESIGPVLREALGHLAHVDVEILVVDDSADERTADVVRACAREDRRIRLVRRQGERGLAAAAAAGWAQARGRVLGLMDGDGQHDPATLPKLLAGLQAEGADIAVASRYAPGAHTGLTGFRHRLSQGGTLLAKLVTGTPTTDPMAGLFLFRREWLDEAGPRMSPVGYKVLLDLALSGRRTPKVFETPTALRSRLGGESKLDLRVIAELGAQLVEKRTKGLLSARFVMFGAVGASGVVVNVGLLAVLEAVGAPFWAAQAGAVAAAMSSNFVLNNLLTFRDRRLTGAAFWKGLLAFYLACGAGALINQIAGMSLHALHVPTLLAGVAGALLAAVWNYSAASSLAWGRKDKVACGKGAPAALATLAARPD
ncbi:glycosyltransferase [Brevundimonas sp. Root1279]|uniref:glycosyltransferase n=1 Tax=Brevundimonas sp. Root1279 TaxID=1736443 RepID=UPI000700C4ED|nr:glycosyltransferase [Brevundimonas sp. Root1279]KQW81846.1 hypothetical protein ASC65_11195 [Brevundimonas sp. Root1279]